MYLCSQIEVFMKKYFLTTCFLIIALGLHAQSQNPTFVHYIAKYKKLAIEQQRKHKVPAAITMAQGLLESGAGTSELATIANNHFGIKCQFLQIIQFNQSNQLIWIIRICCISTCF